MTPLMRQQIILAIKYINVKKFGAKGDGTTDDTAAIQAAINAKSKGTVYIPDGTYKVVAPASLGAALTAKSNVNIKLSSNAVIQLAPNDFTDCYVINVTNASNISITGGTISGDKVGHTGVTGEHGHGINIIDSSNITVSDMTVSYCWGDGIYVGTAAADGFSSNINCSKVILDNNRRQGMSIISVKNMTVKDCSGTNTSGTLPQSGLDLEPNYNTQFLQNVVIDNFHSSGNAGFGICSLFVDGLPTTNVSVTITNHEDVGSAEGTFGNILTYIEAGYGLTVTHAAAAECANIIINGDMADTTGWTTLTNVTVSVVDGSLKVLNTTANADHYARQIISATTAPVAGHTYYVRGRYSSVGGQARISVFNKRADATYDQIDLTKTATNGVYSLIGTLTTVYSTPLFFMRLYVYNAAGTQSYTGAGEYSLYDNIKMMDLAPFGSYAVTAKEMDIYFRDVA